MVAGVFCTARCSRIRSRLHGKTINQKRRAPDSFDIPCSYNTLQWVFRGRCFSFKMSHALGKCWFPCLCFVVTTPHYRCSVANMAWDLVASDGLVLTISGFWRAERTAPMFMTHPLPAEVRMFSVTKCLQPTRIAVERANGLPVFDQSPGRSLRAVASAVGQWSSSVVTSLLLALSNRGALSIFASFKLARVLFGFRSSLVNCAYGAKSIWEESFAFSAVIGVFCTDA